MSSMSATLPTDAMVRIFQRVLETEAVHAESSFFDVGGDSLLATRVLSAVAREHGVELTFDDFVVDPTPSALAALVESHRS